MVSDPFHKTCTNHSMLLVECVLFRFLRMDERPSELEYEFLAFPFQDMQQRIRPGIDCVALRQELQQGSRGGISVLPRLTHPRGQSDFILEFDSHYCRYLPRSDMLCTVWLLCLLLLRPSLSLYIKKCWLLISVSPPPPLPPLSVYRGLARNLSFRSSLKTGDLNSGLRASLRLSSLPGGIGLRLSSCQCFSFVHAQLRRSQKFKRTHTLHFLDEAKALTYSRGIVAV